MENIQPVDELMERIRVCVAFDLIGCGEKIVNYEAMSLVDKKRFIQQSERLYYTCALYEKDRYYIYERYDSIMTEIRV